MLLLRSGGGCEDGGLRESTLRGCTQPLARRSAADRRRRARAQQMTFGGMSKGLLPCVYPSQLEQSGRPNWPTRRREWRSRQDRSRRRSRRVLLSTLPLPSPPSAAAPPGATPIQYHRTSLIGARKEAKQSSTLQIPCRTVILLLFQICRGLSFRYELGPTVLLNGCYSRHLSQHFL